MENELSHTLLTLAPGFPFAVGNDLVYIPDFRLSLTPAFKKKVFRPEEMEYCTQFDQDILRWASTWAAKEAVYKAVKQLDPRPLAWKKIEIRRIKTGGRPDVYIHQELAPRLKISLSISHDGDYAWAIAMISPRA